jgi:chitinase
LDYTAASGTVTFAPGQTQKTIAVVVKAEKLYDNTETFTVNLSSPSGATISQGTGTGTGTIESAVPEPALSIGNVTAKEGVNPVNFNFTVTLSAASSETTTVAYATADGTATAPGDYTATSGTLTFAPGQTKQTISVTVNHDPTYEANENFSVNLSDPAGAKIASGKETGTGTIENDDPPPAISIQNTTVTDSSNGATAVFTVDLAPASGVTATVKYATSNGTAKAGQVYTAAHGTLTFAPGVTSQTVSVSILSDATAAASEDFFVTLSGATKATLSRRKATGTIDQPPAAVVDALAAALGSAPATTVRRQSALDETIRLMLTGT